MYFALIACGIYVASVCVFDPVAHDQPRTKEGCRNAAIQELGLDRGHRAPCVKIRRE